MNEKMRVLELLESGKITADEAAKLIEALGSGPRFITKENRENIEEKLQQFSKDVNKFAKECGTKLHGFYKDVEPKLKKASYVSLEKCATVLDKLAKSIHESMEESKSEDCCCGPEDEPKPN